MSLLSGNVYLKPEVDTLNQNKIGTVGSIDVLNNITPTVNGVVCYVLGVGLFEYQLSLGKWVQDTQSTKVGIDIDTWLGNTVITPDLFLAEASNDDLAAFYLACTQANSLNLPVTLLPRTYRFNDTVDLRKATYGIVSAAKRFAATTLQAIGNASKGTTFVNFQNMDRTRIDCIRIDANGYFDIALDTSYPSVGPSLNMTFENIMVRGFNKIGWLANNNNDVYFKNCLIVEPSVTAGKDVTAFHCEAIGGPVQLNHCNFLNGKTAIAGQHIETIQCVFGGLEFLPGSWNTYSADGTHHFADSATNSCFIITGELWGFTVTGGLCEASDEGYLFNGNGGNTITGKLNFLGVKVTPNTGNMYLDKGSLKIKYGSLIANFIGGMANLSNTAKPVIFDDVSFDSTNNTVGAISKSVVAGYGGSGSNYRTPNANVVTYTPNIAGGAGLYATAPLCGAKGGGPTYFSSIDELSNRVCSGDLYLITDDRSVTAKFQIVNTLNSAGQVVTTIKEIYNICSVTTSSTDATTKVTTVTNDNSFSLYIDKNALQLSLTKGGTSIKRIDWAFYGFNTVF